MDDTITPIPDSNSPTSFYIPSDLQGCFRELDIMLPPSMRENIRACEEVNLFRHHFGLGMWMRNNWGLWSAESLLKQYFDRQEINDADNASSTILAAYRQHLNQKL
jgi:hypothetical protein